MMCELRSAQSGRKAHSSPSDAMKTPSNPCSMAYRIQSGRMPLVQGMLMTMTVGE